MKLQTRDQQDKPFGDDNNDLRVMQTGAQGCFGKMFFWLHSVLLGPGAPVLHTPLAAAQPPKHRANVQATSGAGAPVGSRPKVQALHKTHFIPAIMPVNRYIHMCMCLHLQ